jgi:Glycosyl hydrolase family 9
MSGAAILLMWANLPASMRVGKASAQNARCTAVKQIHYMAGDNDRGSYIAGFGSNPSKRNHHRNAACAPWEQKALGGVCDQCAPCCRLACGSRSAVHSPQLHAAWRLATPQASSMARARLAHVVPTRDFDGSSAF